MSAPNHEESVQHRSLHAELVDRLRRMIIEGELVPGSRIPEKDLCARFDVSRTPLREALKVLASEGTIALRPNRGAVVQTLTHAELIEMAPILGSLEALSGELACASISDGQVEEIRHLHLSMVEMQKQGDLQAYFQLNQAIHHAILDAANNARLTSLHNSLSQRLMAARYHANISPYRWAEAVAEHEQILDALSKREGPRLADLLKVHLANTLATVEEWFLHQSTTIHTD